MADESDGDYVMSLEKGLAVMEAFAQSRAPMTLSEAARITGHSKPSVRRSLHTLCRLGFAVQAGRTFSLAPRALRLAHAYVASDPLTRLAQPVLESASERLRESTSLAVLDYQDSVIVARATHRRSLSAGLSVGARLPVYCSATGRVLLAGRPRDEAEFLLSRMSRPALTPRTVTRLRDVLREVQAARQHGYSVADEELEAGLLSIAVPVRAGGGAVVAALSVAVSSGRLSREQLEQRMLPTLQAAAADLARAVTL